MAATMAPRAGQSLFQFLRDAFRTAPLQAEDQSAEEAYLDDLEAANRFKAFLVGIGADVQDTTLKTLAVLVAKQNGLPIESPPAAPPSTRKGGLKG